MTEPTPPNLSLARNLKMALFHLGSGMADVITTGVWNRIMISDLGFSATPIGLLIALRYFLAPLGLWAGRISDRSAIGGYRRLFWIWLGRGLMALSIAVLGLVTAHIARGAPMDIWGWVIISFSLLMFSLGYAFSGGTFLALIYDNSSEHQRGRAVGIVWTFLLLGFTLGGILFGVLLPENVDRDSVRHSDLYTEVIQDAPATVRVTDGLRYSPDAMQNLFLIGATLMAGFWFFSVVGEERRSQRAPAGVKTPAAPTSLKDDLRLVWRSRPMRWFFWYLALSMAFAFSQDLILEPFAADIFDMPVRVTSSFSAYWGSMAILGTVAFLFLSRRYRSLTNIRMSIIGVITLITAFVMLALSALGDIRPLVTPALILLGLGLGIWNVGTLGLMVDLSPAGRAGTFLGFWTLVVTFARGIGVSGGGILRDIGFQLSGTFTISYGAAFALGAVGLAVSLWALRQVNMRELPAALVPPQNRTDTQTILANAME
jgi:BCD family chlorophyll transporter-like MFS transporter